MITFFPGSFNNFLAMQSVKYSLNAQFSYFFIAPFVVKSKGYDKCVMFGGTMTYSMLSWCSFELTKYVVCSLNDSHKIQNFCETLRPNFFFTSLMYQHMMAWIRFNVSFSLLECFSLYVKTKPVGNLTAANVLFVFPLHISCIGTNSQLIDSASVIVIPLSSLVLFRTKCFEFFSTVVTFSVGQNFGGNWPMLLINSLEMLYVTTETEILCKYCVRNSNYIKIY